jgi:hypothetical protein
MAPGRSCQQDNLFRLQISNLMMDQDGPATIDTVLNFVDERRAELLQVEIKRDLSAPYQCRWFLTDDNSRLVLLGSPLTFKDGDTKLLYTLSPVFVWPFEGTLRDAKLALQDISKNQEVKVFGGWWYQDQTAGHDGNFGYVATTSAGILTIQHYNGPELSLTIQAHMTPVLVASNPRLPRGGNAFLAELRSLLGTESGPRAE